MIKKIIKNDNMESEKGLREDEAIIIGGITSGLGIVQYQNFRIPVINDNEVYSVIFYSAVAILGYFYNNIIGDALLGYGIGGVLGVVI